MKTTYKTIAVSSSALLFALTAWSVPITFRVNMEYRINQGRFRPGLDSVQARGSFQSPTNWTGGFTLAPTPGNTNVYEGTYDVTNSPPGSQVEYKFVVNASDWESRNNRTFVLSAAAQTLPVVYFNDVWGGGGSPVALAFQIDLGPQITLGNFDTNSDSVEVRGSFQSPEAWSGGFTLTNVPGTTRYQGTYPDTVNPPEATVEYKYVLNTLSRGIVWEGRPNRSFTMTNSPQTLALAYFDDITGDPPVSFTFQVNMTNQISSGAFIPGSDTVEVRGEFNGWSGGFALSSTPEAPHIYRGTYGVTIGPPGRPVAYKFVVVDGLGTVRFESRNNRQFTMTNSPQTLPEVFFNDVPGPSDITFQLDLGPQITAGNFDPLADQVEVRGTFQWPAQWAGGWTLTPDPSNTNLYSFTYTDSLSPTGTWHEYKFVLQRPSVGTVWEACNNHGFTVKGGAQTLEDHFNNFTSPPIHAAILFQVDMNAQAAAGGFDRTNDQVWVRGSLFGWGDPPGGLELFEDLSRPGVYTNLFSTNAVLPGEQIQYKFTIWRPALNWATWEDGDNSVAVFTGLEPTNAAGDHQITVGPVFFNGLSFEEILAADTLVTFRVNMNGAVGVGGSPIFNPLGNTVFVNGGFLGWWPWGSYPSEYQMYDDGANGGDAVANDGIYSWQRLIPKGARTRLEYAYSIDSQPNEAGYGQNHVRYIRTTGTYVLPVDNFGVMGQEPLLRAVVAPGNLLRVVVHPPNMGGDHLTFSLDTGAPAGARVNPTNGTFYWTPTRAQASATYPITILVTNLDTPLLSTLETLMVTVRDYLEVIVGWNGAEAGGALRSVPITLASSDGVTNLDFTVGWPDAQLTDVSLTTTNADIALASVVNQTTNLAIHVATAPTKVLWGTSQILWLNFRARPNQPSAFLPLPVETLSGMRATGWTYDNAIGQPGYVAVVGTEPLLKATLLPDGERQLILFGKTGTAYQVQATADLANPTGWQSHNLPPFSDTVQIVTPAESGPVVFYRLFAP